MRTNAQFEAVEAELQRQLDRLYGADPAAVAAATDRLRELAAQVGDELWRQRAMQRAEQLPHLLAGPPETTGRAYHEAQRLYAEAVNSTAPAEERIAELERIMRRIAELSEKAPTAEAGAVLHLNSSLRRLHTSLRQTDG